jgi:hypothetical protein
MFLRNAGINLQVHTELQPREPTLTSSLPRERQSHTPYNFISARH